MYFPKSAKMNWLAKKLGTAFALNVRIWFVAIIKKDAARSNGATIVAFDGVRAVRKWFLADHAKKRIAAKP
jgi:hypothetical protein